MKRVNYYIVLMTLLCLGCFYTKPAAAQGSMKEQDYVDFSSDRSTWFFRLEGGDQQTVFCDFFSPFDPTVKVQAYDPLVKYTLDSKYYQNESGQIMINLEDLKKLYDPYFEYVVRKDGIAIRHTEYMKCITDGSGQRATTLEYTKKVWDITIVKNQTTNKVSASVSYTEYEKVSGGRNQESIAPKKINKEASFTNQSFTLGENEVVMQNNSYYVAIEPIMEQMGKRMVREAGYLAVTGKEMPDVTVEVERSAYESKDIPKVVVPSASNVWNCGSVETKNESYTWADYMNDVADGKRTKGWQWRAFYIPSGTQFKDGNGKDVTLQANRIVPVSFYIPNSYTKEETRLTYMLHGGTGNEHTPSYRIMARGQNVDQIAEDYNYILVSPNGWTQDPLWREGQALYSFEESYKLVMDEYPVAKDKVFITGNSMGGKGTLEIAMRFPTRFQAIAPTAPKIVTRNKDKSTVINIEDTTYDLADIATIPALVVQGTADSTTSFKTQIGNEETPGGIVSGVMSKLDNATYVTVEQGGHSYAYGSVLSVIFDFYESVLEDKDKAVSNEEIKKLEGKTINGVEMVALSSLQETFKDEIWLYHVNSYESDPKNAVDYHTIRFGKDTLNIVPEQETYRINMERYVEDADILKSSAPSDTNKLKEAPRWSVMPVVSKGEVYVPAQEILDLLGLQATVVKNNRTPIMIGCLLLVLAVAAVSGFMIRKKNRA